MSLYSCKKTQCMADEQFHFAINKWDVTKNSNNKNKKQKQEKTKKKQTNNNYKTQKYEQSLENSQNKL